MVRQKTACRIDITRCPSTMKILSESDEDKGSGADEYLLEPAGQEEGERQSSPNGCLRQDTSVGRQETPVGLLQV